MNANRIYRTLLDVCTESETPEDATDTQYQEAKAKVERVLSDAELKATVGGGVPWTDDIKDERA